MKLVDKYSILIYYTLLIVCIFLINATQFYWAFSLLGVAVILMIIGKRKSIKNFFMTNKTNVLDKYLTCSIYVLMVLMFGKGLFIKNMDIRLYWAYSILGIMIILTITLKRGFLKKLFKKRSSVQIKDKEHIEKNSVKLRAIEPLFYVTLGGVLLLALVVGNIDHKSFQYFATTVLIIMFVSATIYEYKNKSIKKQ